MGKAKKQAAQALKKHANQPRIQMVANKSCFKCGHVSINASLEAQREHDCSKEIERKNIKAEHAKKKKAFSKKK